MAKVSILLRTRENKLADYRCEPEDAFLLCQLFETLCESGQAQYYRVFYFRQYRSPGYFPNTENFKYWTLPDPTQRVPYL